MKSALGEQVSEVRASQRLTESAACLVAGGAGPIARSNGCSPATIAPPATKPILELNMRHPIVQAVSHAKKAEREDEVADLSALLFDQAKILDGEVPDDPAAFAGRLNRMVVRGLSGARNEPSARKLSARPAPQSRITQRLGSR